MTKKTGFFVLFAFVFITGTAHSAEMESEKEKGSDFMNELSKKSIARLNKLLSQIKQPTKTDDKKTKKQLRKEAASLYYDSPCEAGTRSKTVQGSSQQPSSIGSPNRTSKAPPELFYLWPGGPVEYIPNPNA